MFGTLRIGSEKNSVEFIEHAKGEAASRLGGYVFSHSACESCRVKKLRCSGHRSGCHRCRSQALKCSYQVAAQNNSSRPKSRSHFQDNLSNTSGAAGTSNAPSPLDNNGVDQEIGGWGMAETDATGSGKHSNLDHLRQGRSFAGELDYSENELNDIFSNIAYLQPDDIQKNVFMGAADPAPLGAEAFDSMTETANSVLDGIGDISASQPASADAQSLFMAFDHARTSPSSSSGQNSDAPASDDFIAANFGRARSGSDPSSCQCRGSILGVLSEIESNILSASPSNMYAILSYLRRTTAASNDILTCRICNCRIKFFGLLGIIGEKITSLSGAIITAFVCRVKEQNDSVDFAESDSSGKRLDRNSAIRLGEFQVQTMQEFKVVSAAVIKLQLKYSVTFVSRTRELAISMNHLAQAQSLKKLESRLKGLFIKMQRLVSEVYSDCCDI
ncbi:hypothetical protein ACN38_g5048 [Penicillium nordicum]|uniref:Zn(2)-C6 fungal-type domain-containing protein n=1 Tax=Penicillium nordicum TaxID=229535 RepID=A0A0M8P2F9_9EURO|nr:hypothetical protein ACN38_g5048 [Penicillium nordicum]